MTSGITEEAAAKMREELAWAMAERLGTWGDDEPACYITAVGTEHPDYYADMLRVTGCDGDDVCTVLPACDYADFLTVEESEYSYARQTSYRGNVIRMCPIRPEMVRGTVLSRRLAAP